MSFGHFDVSGLRRRFMMISCLNVFKKQLTVSIKVSQELQ